MSQTIDPAILALEELRNGSLAKTAQSGAPVAEQTTEVPVNTTPVQTGGLFSGKSDGMADIQQADADRASAWDNIKSNKDLPMLGLMFGLNMLANSGKMDLGSALGQSGVATINAYNTHMKQRADRKYKLDSLAETKRMNNYTAKKMEDEATERLRIKGLNDRIAKGDRSAMWELDPMGMAKLEQQERMQRQAQGAAAANIRLQHLLAVQAKLDEEAREKARSEALLKTLGIDFATQGQPQVATETPKVQEVPGIQSSEQSVTDIPGKTSQGTEQKSSEPQQVSGIDNGAILPPPVDPIPKYTLQQLQMLHASSPKNATIKALLDAKQKYATALATHQYRSGKLRAEGVDIKSWADPSNGGVITYDKSTGQSSFVPAIGPDGKQRPKHVSESTVKGFSENEAKIAQIDDAISSIKSNPHATGYLQGKANDIAPDFYSALDSTSNVDARSKMGDISGVVIHDRSGASVTVGEWPRLKQYVPTVYDSPSKAVKKLENLKLEIQRINKALNDGLTIAGYKSLYDKPEMFSGGNFSRGNSQTNPSEIIETEIGPDGKLRQVRR